MAAAIRRLVTRKDRLRADQAGELKEFVAERAAQLNLPLPLVRAFAREVDRYTQSRSRWSFVMVSPESNNAVVIWLCGQSSRPLVAVQLWSLVLANLNFDSGEVMLTRDQLSDTIGESPENISRIMTELETLGAISRRRERVPGLRGPGVMHYYVNPRLATHLTGAIRDAEQAKAPPLLALLDGGKPG